jgi:poly(hydroxyalkanoate) depolymerase family esterase
MRAPQKVNMKEAIRLTRAGQLDEAMTVIRSALAGSRASDDDGKVSEGAQGASTSPQFINVNRTPRLGSAGLHGFLGRMRQFDSVLGLTTLKGLAVERAPCPALPDGARFEERTFANEAGSRTYKLYLPSSYNGQALPLVVMLHGCTQSPDDFAAGTRMNELAEEQRFIVAYPAQAPSANSSKCWNWFNAADQQRDRGEPSLIAGITRQILRDFSIDPARVYIAGLSAGGAAAAIMGSTYSDLYTAIGVHSGLACGAASDMPSAFVAMKQGTRSEKASGLRKSAGRIVPTIVFHGDRDTTVHPTNGNQIIAEATSATDLQTTVSRGEARGGMSYTRTVQTDEAGQPVLEQWVVHGAGHAWSGGSTAGSYTEPRGPHASREMVRFFFQHERSPDTKVHD